MQNPNLDVYSRCQCFVEVRSEKLQLICPENAEINKILLAIFMIFAGIIMLNTYIIF